MAAAPTLRSISMADCSLTLFPTKTPHPFLSIPSKSIKPLHPSYSPSAPLLSTNRRLPTTPLVAQTSEWAQQGEGAAAEVEELGWSSEEKQDGDVAEESFPEPPEEAKLFVGNLSFNVDSEKLAQLFEQAGVVEVAEVIYNRETDKSRGFGFVTMSTVEEAEKAVEIFNGYDIDGRLLTVNRAAPRGTRPERSQESQPSSKIYVGNLPWQVDDARLGQVFSEHGKVVDARVVCDQETGRSRGFGFVTMASVTEVDDAIAALDGLNLDGRSLRVNVAEQKPRRVPY